MSRWKIAIAVCLTLALTTAAVHLAAQSTTAASTQKSDPRQAMLETAQKAWQAVCDKEEIVQLTAEFIELKFVWSKRICDAQISLAKNPTERVTACKDHLDRMTTSQRLVAARSETEADRIQLTALDYYVAEATALLAEESSATPQK